MKVVLIGDSIMLSLFANAATIMNPGGRTILNLSASGHTAGNQLAAWLASSQRGDLTIDCAVIAVGINDVRTAVPVATTLANVAALRADMRVNNPKMRLALSLMLPARTHQDVAPRYFSHWVPLNAALLAAGIAQYDSVCVGTTAAADDGFGALASGLPWSGEVDKLHPGPAGNREHAKYIRQSIDDAMGLLPCGDLDHATRNATPGWVDTCGLSTNNAGIATGHKCPVCP